MLRTEQALDIADRDGIDERPASVELVPLARPARGSLVAGRIIRPDPGFVAQLIATAAQVPQTRKLRRAAASDAHCAYTAHLRTAPSGSSRTRQVV